MAVVIDTNVLWYPQILDRLAEREVVIPAVVLLERVRQLRQRGAHPVECLEEADRMGWQVAAHDVPHVLASTLLAPLDDATWTKLARDVMIAGHLGQNDELWTINVQDFAAIRIPADNLVNPLA